MEDNQIKSRELFASIRTANRLTYEYQKRILEFISYFKMKFRLDESNKIAAVKRDSNPLGKTQAYTKDDYEEANLRVWTDMWPWDFICTNLMEYYFGWTKRGNLRFCLSFVQMTDSGYYESMDSKRSWISLDRYADINKSHSYGFFVLECVKHNVKNFDSLWYVGKDEMEKWVKSADDVIEYKENDKSKYIVFRFNMEEIINQSSTDYILARFAEIVRQKMDIELMVV